MLKLELLLKPSEKARFTEELQELGLVHLAGSDRLISQPQSDEWKKWLELKEWLEQDWVLDLEASNENWSDLFSEALRVKENYTHFSYRLKKNQEQLEFYQNWSDYNKQQWQELEAIGLQHYLFEGKDLSGLGEQAIPLKSFKGLERSILIYSTQNPPILSLDPIKVPEQDESALRLESAALLEEEKVLKAQVKSLLELKSNLEAWADAHFDHWQFEQGLSVWESSINEKLEGLVAWFEKDSWPILKQFLEKETCAYRLSEPQKGERIPVALENGRFSKLFEPISKIFQLPHYHEFDLTPLIAVFYPILFAYCLGDAGYGALMSLVAITGLFTFLKKQKGLAYLVLILGLSTTIMGLIKSGSLFGIALVPDHNIAWIAALSQLVIVPDDSSYFFNAFNVALLIGVFQILVGLFIAIAKSWRYESFKASLSHWGKLFIIIASVSLFMSETLALNALAATIMKGLLLFGVLLVMFFHDLNLKLFSRIGGSILPLFFIFTGLLGDVLSYVRLFALGVTSAVLGLVVNQIGVDMMGSSWFSIIGASLFLVFGHSLNLVLAVLGSFIHPLRLTFVEFYNNAQFEGGGIEFKPFQKSNRLNITSHGNS